MKAAAEKKKAAKAEELKPAKVKTPGIDLNKRVDEVDKATKKKYK
jgi:GH25 family lysozyme M1 (1,4-beta-N-acetylmuramidase)